MKTLITLCFLATSSFGVAQDYYEIISEDKNTSYRYPADVEMVIIGPGEETETVGANPSIILEGDYRIEIATSWSKEKEVIHGNGQTLKISRAQEGHTQEKSFLNMDEMVLSQQQVNSVMANKPFLEKKDISESKNKEGFYNLEAKFSNGLTFKYKDGKTSALQEGKELVITNRYLVDTPQGTLKLSFDPSDGEFWYVFEI